jgi:hypothetical protein
MTSIVGIDYFSFLCCLPGEYNRFDCEVLVLTRTNLQRNVTVSN